MKSVCRTCEKVFEDAKVTFAEGSGVTSDGKGFSLIPPHDAVPGKAFTEIINEQSGKVTRIICHGSLRPPTISVH